MRPYFLFVFFLVVSHLHFFGQAYHYPEEFNRNYDLNPMNALSTFKKKTLPGLTLDQSNEYRVETMFNTQRMFDNNDVYLDWVDVEAYLYRIIDTLVPDEALKSHTILAYLTRFDSPYAFSYDNGLLYVNIGVFADFPNEACLAAAMAAEIYKIRQGKHFVSWLMQKKIYDNGLGFSERSGWYANGFSLSNYELKQKKYALNEKMTQLDADSFATVLLSKAGYDTQNALTVWKIREQMNKAYEFKLSAQQLERYRQYEEASDWPTFSQRSAYINKIIAKTSKATKAFVVDSAFYCKMHKVAKQEIKRRLFDNGYYYVCLKRSFADYLSDPKNLKNNYWLLESLRRTLYLDSSISRKGFLTAEFRDPVTTATNRSILYIPEALIFDSVARAKILDHPLYADPQKPFHTNEEAFLYFAEQFSKTGLGEADLSRALYLYSKKNKGNYKEYLQKYLTSGIGLYKEFADHWQISGTPDLRANKRLIIFDNTDHNNNYYLTIRKKQMFNKMIADAFVKDSAADHLVLINQLYASHPSLLNHYQKLENLMEVLCDIPEVSQWEERGALRSSRPTPNKQLFVLAPEWYRWLAENQYGKICLDKVSYNNYREDGPLDEVEYESFYQVIDLDLAKSTSRYQQASAKKFQRKQTTAEIVKELQKFIAKGEDPD